MKDKTNQRITRHIRYWILVFFIAILLAFLLRVFLLASFHISTSSMEPTIIPGDYIFVNKQIPGPRIYLNIRNMRLMCCDSRGYVLY
ncbi:MAG: S26 family signal peptidase [Dysgonamonadaceae bacterium]|nr:S26 family signal peptidase [Dysgonamonadaceae bacterium]